MANVSTEGRTGEDEVPPSIAVVEAVAAHDGVDASTLDPPLNSVVDGDALDSLFVGRDEDPNAAVAFTFRGHLVEVAGDGAITVDAVDSADDSGGVRARARAEAEDADAEAEQEVAEDPDTEASDAENMATESAPPETRGDASTTSQVTNH